jgi:hypothetical protein
MILSDLFERFAKQSPVCVMAQGIMERVLAPSVIDQLFEQASERQYTRTLLFSTLVDLMGAVVCQARPSLHAAYQAKSDKIEASLRAVYDKIDGVETVVSEALVRHTAETLGPVIDALGGELPAWLPGKPIRILDGNHLPGTEHRLKPLRDTRAAALPGQALVLLDPQKMLIDDVILCEDGHAQERSLTPDLVARVRPGEVILGDRNFCTTALLFGFVERGADFLIRQHASTLYMGNGPLETPTPGGRCETGEVFEQARVLHHPDGRSLTVRCITLRLDQPTRNGEVDIRLLTTLPASVADAATVARLYRRRWTLETAFQELEATLNSEIETLGYPKAALFAFSLALVSYNVLAGVKAALRAVHGQATVQQTLSGYYLADEIAGTYRGMMIAIPGPEWAVFIICTVAEFASALIDLARRVRLSAFKKHPRGPKKPPLKKRRDAKKKHVATARLLNPSWGGVR